MAGDTTWSKTTPISADVHQETVISLTVDTQYALKIVAENEKGESVQSGILYQYSGAVPAVSNAPTIVAGSRTETSVMIDMYEPDASTTTVLGYRLYANDVNSNAVPTNLVYDGQAVANVLSATVYNLESGQGYWLAYKVLNRAGWSELSPYLKIVAGKLPQPPSLPPYQLSVSPTEVSFGWTPPAEIGGAAKLDGYYVYEASNLIGTVDADTLEFAHSAVAAGTSYSISIAAFSAIGEGAKSNPLTIWAINVPDAPTLTLTDTSRDSCSVQWTTVTPPANSLITGYVLEVDDGLDGEYSIAYNGRDNPSTTSYTAEGLVA